MGIPAQSRWWVFTLIVIGALVLISMLALDRPDVIWAGTTPECPHCRHEVRPYAHRCADCGGEFDWASPGEEDSPISSASLSAQEAEWVRDRVKALTPEVAAQRVAEATGLRLEVATLYLETLGQGDCGWCGGTRRDPAAPDGETGECPACFGSGDCVECGGDRRIRIGDQRAARALASYERELADILASKVPDDVKLDEARRLARTFLASHEGTAEAARIRFWPDLMPRTFGATEGEITETSGGRARTDSGRTIVDRARARLNAVLLALKPDAN